MKNTLLIILLILASPLYGQLQLSPNKLYETGVVSYKAEDYKTCEQSMTKFFSQPHRNKTFDPNAYYMRGVSNYYLDEAEKSVADLRTAIYSGAFERDNANLFLGMAFVKMDKPDEAIKAFTTVIESSKKSEILSSAFYHRGVTRESKGDRTAANEDFKLALEKNSNNTDAANKVSATYGDTYSKNRGNETKTEVSGSPKTTPTVKTATSAIADTYKGEKRIALVVGNSLYPKEIGVLKNPANDAQDIAAELKRCNFEVELLINATHRQIEIAANNLFKKLNDGPKDQTVGLFFYAGHGLQFEGTNYLVPVDASITTPTDVVYACYPADKILGKMEFANSRMNIVILDACRNNPFPATTRSGAPQGLAQVRAAKGAYVAFATAPGSVASDGAGRNGLYTQELLKAMKKSNITIEQLFKEVRLNVSQLSGGKQSTWDNSNIVGDFYFKMN